MQELWNIMKDQSTYVYVIAGVCLWGILSRLILQGKFLQLLRASENMAATTKKQLREIRNHYENNLTMDRQVYNIHAYVDKYLLKLKLGGIPIRIWSGATMEMALLSVAFGALGVVNSIHKGYGESVIFGILFATIISCACLLTMENIFRIENSYDRLQANIEDYLENNLQNRLKRPISERQERWKQTRTGEAGRESSRPADQAAETGSQEKPCVTDRNAAAVQQAAASILALNQAAAGWETGAVACSTEGGDLSTGESLQAGQEAELVAQVLRNFFSS